MKQFELFDKKQALKPSIPIEEVFEAYYACRKNKRRTINALRFELDFEEKLVKLWRDINSGKYQIGKSIAFIVKKPVQREIFAADFRDRIVHHLIINKLNPLFESVFNPHSYSCREGKGTLFGVRDIQKQIQACSENGRKKCYVLKMDIQSFFMSIDKKLLHQMLYLFIQKNYQAPDKNLVLSLVKKIVFNCPENACRIKGKTADWNGLPCSKSLFWSEGKRGLAIGNLTSQVFANVYLNELDQFVQKELGFPYYGRYVDDFVLIHHDREALKQAVQKIKAFLQNKLHVKLHPQKIYLQEASHGVRFIGALVKPWCVFIGKRTKQNLYEKIYATPLNLIAKNPYKLDKFCASINSYLGFMCHYNTFRLRRKILRLLEISKLKCVLKPEPDALKLCLAPVVRLCQMMKNKLRRQKKLHLLNLYGTIHGRLYSLADLS